MHEQPVYIKDGLFKTETYQIAEYLARKGFYIPSGLALTTEQMDEVVDKVVKVIKSLY
jgi:perosamine synthetase